MRKTKVIVSYLLDFLEVLYGASKTRVRAAMLGEAFDVQIRSASIGRHTVHNIIYYCKQNIRITKH